MNWESDVLEAPVCRLDPQLVEGFTLPKPTRVACIIEEQDEDLFCVEVDPASFVVLSTYKMAKQHV